MHLDDFGLDGQNALLFADDGQFVFVGAQRRNVESDGSFALDQFAGSFAAGALDEGQKGARNAHDLMRLLRLKLN